MENGFGGNRPACGRAAAGDIINIIMSTEKMITVRLDALRRGSAADNSIELPLGDAPTVGDALARVREQFPELPLEDGMVILTVNDALVQPDRRLAAGDVVMVIPPIEGG